MRTEAEVRERFEDTTLLALKIEEEAMRKKKKRQVAGKGKETNSSLEPLEVMQFFRPILDFRTVKYIFLNVLF